MPMRKTRESRTELDRLIEAVENGEIDAIEDLTREEVALLLECGRPEESLQDLFDRLRQGEPTRE